ncbi:hypothetical protein [Bacillus sp. 165]|uniref:hypothetical protein n=1 Tax=Bacillus sp. 165 TaxID=1529117 RepID=UPI001ADBBC65|nr:hypothetical protein [Bacillus sp. 165]MBO9129288.1 hypothetical protein [Bacillus sp. 165]
MKNKEHKDIIMNSNKEDCSIEELMQQQDLLEVNFAITENIYLAERAPQSEG